MFLLTIIFLCLKSSETCATSEGEGVCVSLIGTGLRKELKKIGKLFLHMFQNIAQVISTLIRTDWYHYSCCRPILNELLDRDALISLHTCYVHGVSVIKAP